jgi:MFS family permease
MSGSRLQGRQWVLAAMIFAVSMTFIDQTTVSIAIPNMQRELGLSFTGVEWVINAYLIALAALFALGGRLSDIFGHTKMCMIGVVIFAFASTMCGLNHIAQYQHGSGSVASIPHFVSVDFAHSTQVVLYVMAAVMAAAAVVALLGLEAGRQETVREESPAPARATGG